MRYLTTLLLFAMTTLLMGCFLLEEPEESTGAVVAPTLAVATNTTEPTAIVEEPTAVVEEATEIPVDEPTAVVEEITETDSSTSVATVYTIDATQSEARFLIDEVLRGEDVTVVGVTSNVAGQVALDISNPASTQVGTIVINARDITTDSNGRNRAISNAILLTDEYELITFAPTAINGLPESVALGESYTFQIVGDLTITDQTRAVTFDATVTPDSETQLVGLASAEILYADFNLEIPFSQSVDAVEDTVILELEFVALADR